MDGKWSIWTDNESNNVDKALFEGSKFDVKEWFKLNGREEDENLFVLPPDKLTEWYFNSTSRELEQVVVSGG
jgi:hypothetical protein